MKNIFRNRPFQIWILSLAIIMLSTAMNTAQAETRRFNHPRYGGYAVDRCLYWGQQCDWPAAHAFCRAMGYQKAVRYRWDYMAPTRIIGSGKICRVRGRGGCGGFTMIDCFRQTHTPPPPHTSRPPHTSHSNQRTFNYPKLHGYYVDRCLYYGRQCNQPAADAFCRAVGYDRASYYKWDYMAPTRIIATGQICKVPGRGGCGGFTKVICVRGGYSHAPAPTTGGRPAGSHCNRNTDCRSGICLLGICSE